MTRLPLAGHLLVAVAALTLVEQLLRNTRPEGKWAIKYFCFGVGGLFAFDLYLYAKALLFKLEGQMLEIVNHRWIEDSVRNWRRMPEESEVYRKLGVEVDFEERLDAEKKLRMDVEAQLEEEERSRRNLQELLEAEERARQEMQQQLLEEESQRISLRTQLEGEGQNREALQHQFSRSRSDIDSLQSLLQQSEASRAKQEQQLLAAEEGRRGRELAGKVEVVGHDHCCPPRTGQASDELEDDQLVLGIQGIGRLVDQKQVSLLGQRSCDQSTLALPPGEGRQGPIRQVGQNRLGERTVDRGAIRGRRPAE